MNQKAPQMRRHATGQWMVRWGGKDHYLGLDREKAQEAYLRQLTEWTAWRAARNMQRLPPMRKTISVLELSRRFLEVRRLERGIDCWTYYRKHLRRFLHGYADHQAHEIRASDLEALKIQSLRQGFAAATVNHDIVAAKTMLTWGMDMELIPAVNLRAARQIRLPEPPDKAFSWPEVLWFVYSAPPQIGSWLGLQYLGLMRPIEVVRLVHQDGSWDSEGVFRMEAKRRLRYVVLSEEALEWLKICRPTWGRLDSYSQAVRDACGPGGPHPLRHSAATHLRQRGVARADIDLALGHMPPRVSRIYAQIDWQSLRETTARLSLRPLSATAQGS